jgi:RNA polymerase sigma-70 factor (ECF subfamily)
MATRPTDSELARIMRGGDIDAFAELYRRRQRDVYRFALHMTGMPDVAEDVTQEVFMVFMSDDNRFDETKGSVNSFLLGIARNYVLRRLRKDRSFVAIEDVVGEMTTDETGAGEALTRNLAIESMRQAVLNLPAHYREAVVLCDLHELSYVEAADVLGCAIGTIRSRLNRGRAILIARLRSTRSESTASPELESTRCFA